MNVMRKKEFENVDVLVRVPEEDDEEPEVRIRFADISEEPPTTEEELERFAEIYEIRYDRGGAPRTIFEVEITMEDGKVVRYGQPELVGVDVDKSKIELEFDPVNFSETHIEYEWGEISEISVGNINPSPNDLMDY